ncbi:MAG TPA: YdeI/OmpD-associated family protein [Niabella sp.]|nr:YdeI/OmpD-associated family protein [Niabella sp.]HOZ95984.1 YdeI/OmpD-associated family protein [Niabella sp.]HQW15521.1 YdeI/OmpD-associated family protein [Niabella sp.]HQX20663.1 YdeI/OmpD-associated family protein [Niabella sp.]HQX40539.1 YdeI/OmpD-associated family protein [Niabella sp.]
MSEKQTKIFYPSSQVDWRKWLQKNHSTEKAVWLVFYNKSSAKTSISWSEAVDEALCFGWIDSKKIKIDEETSHQFFSKRKPKSTWSKINKEKVRQLIKDRLMTDAGLDIIEKAKQNGSWTILDEVEELVLPKDLETEFRNKPKAKDFFLRLSKSAKKAILQWLVLARTTETRQKRIAETVESAEQNQKPKHLR